MADIDSEFDMEGEFDIEDDGASKSDATNSSNDSPAHTESKYNGANNDDTVIAKEETKALFRMRLLLVTILALSAATVAACVYLFISGGEQADFDDQFDDDSDKILDSVANTLGLMLGSVDAFVVSLVSFAEYTEATWPYVTLPDYSVRIAKIKSLSKTVLVSQYHYVEAENRQSWEEYSVANDYWVDESIEVQRNDTSYVGKVFTGEYQVNDKIHVSRSDDPGPGPYLPKWQHSPVIPYFAPYNWDAFDLLTLALSWPVLVDEHKAVLSKVTNLLESDTPEARMEVEWNNAFMKDYVAEDVDPSEPFSEIHYPILKTASGSVISRDTSGIETVAGLLSLTFYWRALFENILPADSDGIIIVVSNTCEQSFTYQVNGPDAVYLGPGDLHEREYTDLARSATLSSMFSSIVDEKLYTGLGLASGGCRYTVQVYPSSEMEGRFKSSDPLVFTLASIAIFLFSSVLFFLYDYLVERRQSKVMANAARSNAIVSSLFPSTVRDRLFPAAGSSQHNTPSAGRIEPTKNRLKSFLTGSDAADGPYSHALAGPQKAADRPIADLFPDTTVLFCDVCGFTSWSSTRDPSQVFLLLEAIYGAYDAIAAKRGVYKVETIGDSYVAVTGLPEPRKDHAPAMARFARTCRLRMAELIKELELTLGPGTGDLQMRFGLHSGPVTAGVLRGQRSRFQLFGDTVNTAARMESTGMRDRIQLSHATAQLLTEAGKSSWFVPRKDLVEAKGKGVMQTYWLVGEGRRTPSVDDAGSVVTSHSSGGSDSTDKDAHNNGEKNLDRIDSSDALSSLDQKTRQLTKWNAEILGKLLCGVIGRRTRRKSKNYKRMQSMAALTSPAGRHPKFYPTRESGTTVIDEVKEIIELPAFDACQLADEDYSSVQLPPRVSQQLHDYVADIAKRYNNHNAFHNFDHASHVAMSALKLMSRIVAPDSVLGIAGRDKNALTDDGKLASTMHDHTYGITSDPLTQFACVFSALIHDVDHTGAPNAQLVKEDAPIARRYKGKSVAEQNSVDVAWDLLMLPKYDDLRSAICGTEDEMQRFRQLVINTVISTDIMDRDLKNLRNARWEKAFAADPSLTEPDQTRVNRKATIVIDHLILASDVAHTMQHWHVYRKWNERLFQEMHAAYKSGRADQNPAYSWYENEIGFFDFYIIPLAKKLQQCGIFGVSSDEYLNYAQKNRDEWKERGRDVVAGMVERLGSGGGTV